jgi:hypothetical protein
MVKTTGAAVPEVAVTMLFPATVAIDHESSVATPAEFVIALGPVRYPALAVNFTSIPDNGWPLASRARTDGGSVARVPTVPVREVGVRATSSATVPGGVGMSGGRESVHDATAPLSPRANRKV